jgi:hypothetical protein
MQALTYYNSLRDFLLIVVTVATVDTCAAGI